MPVPPLLGPGRVRWCVQVRAFVYKELDVAAISKAIASATVDKDEAADGRSSESSRTRSVRVHSPPQL